MFFDFDELDGPNVYKLMTATVVPRPIAWVVSANEEGRLNAAPFSFFGLMSGDPPIVAVGISARAGQLKDTSRNLLRHGDFALNLVSQETMEKMNVTAIEFGPDVNELEAAGLTAAPGRKIAVPHIAESPVSLECRTEQTVPLGDNRHIIVARVLAMHIRDNAVLDAEKCYIDTPALNLVGRLHGRGWYGRLTDNVEMPRLTLEQFTKGQQ